MDLKDLKNNYEKLRSKYKLPDFQSLNEYFEVDRIERGTDTLLREVRKVMIDKVVKYIQLIEMLINPAQAPQMFLLFVRKIGESDKKILDGVYEKLIEVELDSLRLEVDYSEKNEAVAIIKIFNMWKGMKPDLTMIIDIMGRNWKNSGKSSNGRGYLG